MLFQGALFPQDANFKLPKQSQLKLHPNGYHPRRCKQKIQRNGVPTKSHQSSNYTFPFWLIFGNILVETRKTQKREIATNGVADLGIPKS